MKIKLKQAFDLQMGKTPARNQAENWGGNHRWVSIADIGNAEKYIAKTKECITDAGINASGIKVVPQGTVIMSFKLSIGKTAITAQDMYTNEAIIAFIDKKIFEIDPNYLYHLCCGTDWTAGTNKAVMGLTLNKATLLEKEISLPDICQQRKIAAKLDKIDAIIADRQQQLTMIEQAVKSRFIELFGNYINEGGKPLSELATITGGLTKNSKRNAFNLKMPYLRVANVFFNRLDLNEILEIGVREDEIGKTLLQTGDLLFVEGNGSIEQIGRVAIWDGSISPILHQNHLIKARFHKKTILPEFALFYFMSQEGRQQIISKSVSTSGLNTLSVNKISSLILPMPPIELQKQFAAFVAQTDKSKYYSQKFLTLCRSAVNIYEQEWMKCQTLIF